MYLKIRRNYGDRWNEVPEKTFECDRFDRDPYHPDHGKVEAAESFYCDADGEVKPIYTLTLFKGKKFMCLLIIGHATIFVMGDDGKTIDTIYA